MTAPVLTAPDAVEPSTFHNGTIGRLDAWFFDVFDRYINIVSRRPKQHAFSDIGTVVETPTTAPTPSSAAVIHAAGFAEVGVVRSRLRSSVFVPVNSDVGRAAARSTSQPSCSQG